MALLDDLNRPIGELALRAGAISKQNRDAALEVQQRIMVLHAKLGPDATKEYFKNPENVRGLQRDDVWDQLRINQKITAQDMAAAREHQEQRKPAPDGVPRLGEMISALRMVPQEVIQPLLAAQARGRAHAMFADVEQGITPGKPATPRENDPDYLKDAQTNALKAYDTAMKIMALPQAKRAEALKSQEVKDIKVAADVGLVDVSGILRAAGMTDFAVKIEEDVNQRNRAPSAAASKLPVDFQPDLMAPTESVPAPAKQAKQEPPKPRFDKSTYDAAMKVAKAAGGKIEALEALAELAPPAQTPNVKGVKDGKGGGREG